MQALLKEARKAKGDTSDASATHSLTLADVSPPMHPRRAEAFLPWQLPGMIPSLAHLHCTDDVQLKT